METTKENGLMIFQNEEFGQVRSVTVNGEPWFVGKDVCEAFGDTNYRRSLGNIDHCDKSTTRIETAGGVQNMTTINESGLYSLLFQMQPKKAKGVSQNEHPINERLEKLHRFKRWVTSEVLPALRKTGTYSMQNMTVSDQIKLLAEGYSEVETRLEKIQGVTQDLDSRIEYIEKTLDVLESNNNAGKLLNLKRAVVAKSYELTAGNGVYEVLWQRNFIASNYSNIKRLFDVARIGQIPASQYDTVMEMARSWKPRDIYLQNKIAEMQGQREKNLLGDKKLIALLQYLRDTDDGKINPFKK